MFWRFLHMHELILELKNIWLLKKLAFPFHFLIMIWIESVVASTIRMEISGCVCILILIWVRLTLCQETTLPRLGHFITSSLKCVYYLYQPGRKTRITSSAPMLPGPNNLDWHLLPMPPNLRKRLKSMPPYKKILFTGTTVHEIETLGKRMFNSAMYAAAVMQFWHW